MLQLDGVGAASLEPLFSHIQISWEISETIDPLEEKESQFTYFVV